jgi:small subunit ribosomal protein S20
VANIKSQIKRNRQNEARRLRNKSVRTALKTGAKKVHATTEGAGPDATQVEIRRMARQLDKAASKGVIHRRTAARRKSRLARSAAAASAPA